MPRGLIVYNKQCFLPPLTTMSSNFSCSRWPHHHYQLLRSYILYYTVKRPLRRPIFLTERSKRRSKTPVRWKPRLIPICKFRGFFFGWAGGELAREANSSPCLLSLSQTPFVQIRSHSESRRRSGAKKCFLPSFERTSFSGCQSVVCVV